MSCPLYKRLKPNGITFYAFPGSAEDISASYQNSNYKMYFSKYVLLNFPKQNLSGLDPIQFNFEDAFSKSSNATPATNFSESIVESLRNYVANHEVVVRESRLSNNEYYYNTNALETTSEKIFWKWCSKLNIIDFEPAIPSDEYFDNLIEFESLNINDEEYFPEYLWKEREIIDWETIYYRETDDGDYFNYLEIEFDGTTNFKEGDIINIYNVSNSTIISNGGATLSDIDTEEGIKTKILKIIPIGATQGQRIIVDIESTLSNTLETTGQARLVYNRLVRYIGEVNGVSNVQEANRSYTEVYAHIPDHTGQTPDILFRTLYDENYKPNMEFPILPSQYQPEILGAENFLSPIVSSPQNYPGSYFGQFDSDDFTYLTKNGDYLRRSGDYFGISGTINNPVVDGSKIDGITLDFDRNHYVKMNIPNRVVTNFDQFNAMMINNEPPLDFEFNAILWYYTIEDNNGNTRSNLYGISFLDNPENNIVEEYKGIKFPTYKKLVTNGKQDGISYSFNLSLNFNIINENPIETYNPQSINSLFSMDLFNQAMSKLSSTNDSFLNIISEQNYIKDEIDNIKQLIYTQTDINIINAKIVNLELLLRLYSTNQLVSSNTIQVINIPGSPPTISLNNITPNYIKIDNIKTSELYGPQGILPINLSAPLNSNYLINIVNDDIIDYQYNDNLIVVLDKDLYINQTIEINILSSEESIFNKKLDIYMISDAGSVNGETSEVLLIGDIDLPVFFNDIKQVSNSAYLWNNFKFEIDFDSDIIIDGSDLTLKFKENGTMIFNSISEGDTLYLNNLFIGTSSVYDYSGQYKVKSVGATNSTIIIDISSNEGFVNYYSGNITTLNNQLCNKPYFSLNKGKNIKINRISNSSVLKDRYLLQINNII